MRYAIALLWSVAVLWGSAASAGLHRLNLSDVAQFDILRGWQTSDGSQVTALRIRLADGWKTYWRAPGEGGIPPQFDWARSNNLSHVTFHWPRPRVFYQNGMRSVGFERELILPIELHPVRKGQPITMRADVRIGVCETICIPMDVQIAAEISGTGAQDARISAAMKDKPVPARSAGLRSATCRIAPISDGVRLEATVSMPAVGQNEETVIELPDASIWIAEPMSHREGNTLTTVADMVAPSGKPFSINRSQVRITVITAHRAVQIDGCSG